MKEGIFPLLALILLLSSLYCTPTNSTAASSPTFDKYTIKVSLVDENRSLVGYVVLEHYNKHPVAFDRLYFHVYPNAPVFRATGGSLIVKKVLVDGVPARYSITGEDGTILEVSLPKELPPRGSVLVNISFETRVPYREDRLGYYLGVYALGHWYPILAVYDERGWNLDPYYDEGESFYFECAYYTVEIEVPRGYIVAATGVLESVEDRGNTVTYRWVTPLPVREFACSVSPNYKVITKTVDLNGRTVKVYSYYLEGHETAGEIALEAAAKSIKVFSELFGPYVYPELRVAEVHGWFGGMEYPMYVMITSRLYRPEYRELLELVVSHEVAHNWWYGMVGNHEGLEPFMDEAFAEYSDTLYFEAVYGEAKFREVFDRYVRRPYYRFLERRGRDYPLHFSVFDFQGDSYAYFNVIYNKGALVLHMLRYVMGDEKFFSLLKRIQNNYRFGVIRLVDFRREAEAVYGASLRWFFDSWIYGSGIPHYRVEAEARPIGLMYEVSLEVINEGKPVVAPVPVRVNTRLASLTVVVWVNGTRGSKTCLIPFEPVSVVVDPDDVIPGEDYWGEIPVKLRLFSRVQDEVALMSLIALLTVVNAVYERRSQSSEHIARGMPGNGDREHKRQVSSVSQEGV